MTPSPPLGYNYDHRFNVYLVLWLPLELVCHKGLGQSGIWTCFDGQLWMEDGGWMMDYDEKS